MNEPTGIPAPTQGQLRSARRLTRKKFRVETGTFLAEGPQSVREALAVDGTVTELFVADDSLARNDDFIAAARARRIPVLATPPAELAELTDTVTPQGLVAVCRSIDTELDQLQRNLALVVVCAQIRDPGNAGSVIRAADAFGADAVIFSSDSVEVHNPKVVRASAGSVFHLPIVTGAHLRNTVEFLRDKGMLVLAAEGGGSDRLDHLDTEGALAGPVAWMMGNEAWGLPPEHAVLADRQVAVPIFGGAESLNLATAAAVCLYTTAAAQQRANPVDESGAPIEGGDGTDEDFPG